MTGRAEVADTFFAGCGHPEGSAGAIEERLRLILEVRPGERPLLPAFGCRVHDLEAIETEHERQVAAALIEKALRDWAPWVGVRRVNLLEVEGGRVRLRLTGRIPALEFGFHWREAAGFRALGEEKP